MVDALLEAISSAFVLNVKETPALWPEESARAGILVTCHNHVEPMRWRYLIAFGKDSVMVRALPRGHRGDVGKVQCVTTDRNGCSKQFTQEFEAFVLTIMREMPVKRAVQFFGEGGSWIWPVLFAHPMAAHARLSFDNVVLVEAREINQAKGHN